MKAHAVVYTKSGREFTTTSAEVAADELESVREVFSNFATLTKLTIETAEGEVFFDPASIEAVRMVVTD